VQDDVRLARSLMLNAGVRYELQSLVSDRKSILPRTSLTWSPFKSGRTTFRGGAGFFADWLSTMTYRQALQVDGFRQRELNIRFPSYPMWTRARRDVTLPANRYLLGDDLVLPSGTTLNAGIDQQVVGQLRANVATRTGADRACCAGAT
jgi:hypothetical protein